jgi:hypothetical protein
MATDRELREFREACAKHSVDPPATETWGPGDRFQELCVAYGLDRGIAMHTNYTRPRLCGQSPAEQRWEGVITEENVRFVAARAAELLDGRAFMITRAFEYNGWELEVFPVARLREEGDDAGVYIHRGHVEFAAAGWHWALSVGDRLRFESDRLHVWSSTPEGKEVRLAFARLEDARDLCVVLSAEEAAVAYSGLFLAEAVVSAKADAKNEEALDGVLRHVERVLGDKDAITRWLP